MIIILANKVYIILLFLFSILYICYYLFIQRSFEMPANLWNTLIPSTRIDFYYKIDQQKKHLQNLKNVKTSLVTLYKRSHKAKNNSDLQSVSRHNKNILKHCNSQRFQQNQLPNIQNIAENNINEKHFLKERKYDKNCKNINEVQPFYKNHSKEHNRVQRLITQQNNRLFKRLQEMKASPSISKKKLIKDYLNSNLKYRVNIQKTRYKNPDFTNQAQRLLKGQKVKFKKISCQKMEESPDFDKYRYKIRQNFR